MKSKNFYRVILPMQLALSFVVCAEKPAMGEGPVRRPAVAGAFYPGDPAQLGAMVDQFLSAARIPDLEGRVRALIAPHAGYVFSGGVAGYAIKAVEGRRYDAVVLIGNSHREGYYGVAVSPGGSFRTPLGDVPIDEALAKKLLDSSPLIVVREIAHAQEHSLEVLVPFLQRAIGEFKLVPILLGDRATELSRALASALARHAGENTLVIASTDLSHYPTYEDAVFADGKTMEAIASGDVDHLERTIRQLEAMRIPDMATLMCGEGATKAVMFYAKAVGANRIERLKYANSGDSPQGGRKGVVGYGAVVFLAEHGEPQAQAAEGEEERLLSDEERAELLKLARMTVETVVKTGKRPEYRNTNPAFEQPLGVFVTIKQDGQLRGCIGRFEPDIPLYRIVMEMAIASATQDGRFSPVSEAELPRLTYEISVLSPLRRVESWRDIELGRHGVQVTRGMRRGVFLPHVATETGWDFETFMNQLCAGKAGLPPDAWKDPATDLLVFTAEVFHEE